MLISKFDMLCLRRRELPRPGPGSAGDEAGKFARKGFSTRTLVLTSWGVLITHCVTADADEIIPGLDLAVQEMKLAEEALITLSPQYAYGDKGFKGPLADVPPNTTVTYRAHLVSFDKVQRALLCCAVSALLLGCKAVLRRHCQACQAQGRSASTLCAHLSFQWSRGK